jgi:hypothetical protein
MKNSPAGSHVRNCRHLLVSSQHRRQAMAESFDRQWHELRRHITVERDAKKLSQLAADVEKRNRMAESAVYRNGI